MTAWDGHLYNSQNYHRIDKVHRNNVSSKKVLSSEKAILEVVAKDKVMVKNSVRKQKNKAILPLLKSQKSDTPAMNKFRQLFNIARSSSVGDYRNILIITDRSKPFRDRLRVENVNCYDCSDLSYQFSFNEYEDSKHRVIFLHNIDAADIKRCSRLSFWTTVAKHTVLTLQRKSRSATVRNDVRRITHCPHIHVIANLFSAAFDVRRLRFYRDNVHYEHKGVPAVFQVFRAGFRMQENILRETSRIPSRGVVRPGRRFLR